MRLGGHHEGEQHREVRARDQHDARHRALHAARGHRATACLQVGEDHLRTALDERAAQQLLDVGPAQPLHLDRREHRAFAADRLHGRYEARRKVGVAGHERPLARAITHDLHADSG
jgi:hypothetical protein